MISVFFGRAGVASQLTIKTSLQSRLLSTNLSKEETSKLTKQLRALPKLSVDPPVRGPLTGFSYFIKEKHNILQPKAKEQKITLFEAGSKVWKDLHPSEQDKFNQTAESAKAAYRTAHEKWVSKLTVKDIVVLQKEAALKKRLGVRVSQKPPVLPGAPTRPTPPFGELFRVVSQWSTSKQLQELGRSLEGVSAPERLSTIAAYYKRKTPSEKAQLLATYQREQESYKRSKATFDQKHNIDEIKGDINKMLHDAVAGKSKKKEASPKSKECRTKSR
ncbi:hypothetical protein BC832DRAFT_106192 [Gaertneriomyces semiglobifer]|nr:hypothetical protein BC832DRAFT_106192 [Gaertneriomyces semiglobifer]